MAEINWNELWNSQNGQSRKKRYHGANVFFFNAYVENTEKSIKEGRPIFDEIPSISIQWPGQDITVRRIEPQDLQDYPEKYAAFRAGNEPVESGTPLKEWPVISGSVVKELLHLGFKTVEQLAEANDEVKRKLGTAGRFVKMAKDWMAASKSDQFQVTKLQQQLDAEIEYRKRLENKLELFMQRIEANEGTDLRDVRRRETVYTNERSQLAAITEEVGQSLDALLDDSADDDISAPARRGRPRKV